VRCVCVGGGCAGWWGGEGAKCQHSIAGLGSLKELLLLHCFYSPRQTATATTVITPDHSSSCGLVSLTYWQCPGSAGWWWGGGRLWYKDAGEGLLLCT
jgi:hypothetical protein